MNIFNFTNYRSALTELVAERKKFDRTFGYHSLADAAQIQRPYFSKVMNGTAHFSTDQLYLVSKALRLSNEEFEFIQLLLDFERSNLPERKDELQKKIRTIVEKNRDTAKHLKANSLDAYTETKSDSASGNISEYYLDPYMQIVHVALSIEVFSLNPLKLVGELGIASLHLHRILNSLERIVRSQTIWR